VIHLFQELSTTKRKIKNKQYRDHLEDLGIDRRIILKLILKKYGGRVRTNTVWLRTGLCIGGR
jgi:hypothetical protein